MRASEAQLLKSFKETLHYLSKYTRDAYQRDLNYLQTYCIKQNIQKWSELRSQQLRDFISSRHRKGISGRSLQRNLSSIVVTLQNDKSKIFLNMTKKKINQKIEHDLKGKLGKMSLIGKKYT